VVFAVPPSIMAYAHHGGATGSFTHTHHWEFYVALLAGNRFLTANAKEAGHAFGDREAVLGSVVDAKAEAIGEQEIWTLEWIPEKGQVAFRAHHSNFLSCPADGKVHANQAARSDFEHWVLTDLGDGFVGLKSPAPGTFLAVDAASGAVTATAGAPGPDSKLRIVLAPVHKETAASLAGNIGETTLAVQAGTPHPVFPVCLLADHKDWLAATPDTIHAEKAAESEADVFFLDIQAEDRVSLRTPHGKYATSGPGGGVVLADSITADATWRLVRLVDGRIGLESTHKRYLAAEPSGRVVADRATPGDWEAFRIVPGPRTGLAPAHVKAANCINYVVVTDHHLGATA